MKRALLVLAVTSLLALTPVTLLLHKPAGVAWQDAAALATPATHMAGDDSGVRPLKRHLHRLTALGRDEIAEELQKLAEEIKEEANDVLGYAPTPKKKKNKRNRPEDDGPVLAVLFNQFIVQ